jgi:hypothetical protein
MKNDAALARPHLDSLCCLNGDLVIGGIAARQAQIEVDGLQIEVREDELQHAAFV